jgi:hypothetical protein
MDGTRHRDVKLTYSCVLQEKMMQENKTQHHKRSAMAENMIIGTTEETVTTEWVTDP